MELTFNKNEHKIIDKVKIEINSTVTLVTLFRTIHFFDSQNMKFSFYNIVSLEVCKFDYFCLDVATP